MDETENTNNMKKMIIIEETKTTSKKVNVKKERKMRVETKTWGLNETDLSHNTQLAILENIHVGSIEKTKYNSLFVSHIKTKIGSYKQQDVVKKKIELTKFVTFNEVIELLHLSGLKCHYCSDEVFILYEKVREMKQWSLDRINNDIGHNSGNLVIACLECNLRRRRTNKDAFMFTKNMVIIREGM